MKLHIPVLLRKALLACFAVGTLYSGGTTIAADLTLGSEDTLSINYAESDSIPDLESGTLQLNGDTLLLLAECGEGNGKTYTLLTGVSGLLDKDGNALALDSSNNAASQYFDTTQPGTGFWADAKLHLTTDGTLQLVRHNETVKDAVTITTRQTGGADYQYYEGVSLKDINSTSASGGAIYGYGSTITLSNNGSVTFSGNTASAYYSAEGGAIHGGDYSTITLSGNGSVEFSGNTASSYEYSAHGGAICGGSITLSDNGSVEFSGNTASASDYCARGGAICGWDGRTIELSNNGSVTFSGNTASAPAPYDAHGGAIYSWCGSVIITGNDEVTFAQNVEKSGTAYRLRCLYLRGYESSDKLTLSAGEKQSIRFYDSVYMGASGSVALNADYTDAEGATQKATGTILFSGATTEDDLKDAKGGVAGTEEEILNSRTSEINSAATLYGGTLQVQDKAVLKLNGGLTVAEGSKASVQVQAAELSVGSHALNMVSGSSLELSDGAKLTATELTITTGATLAVRGSVSTAPLTATVSALTLSDETVAGFDASRAVNTGSVSVLEGDLTLESGSLLSLDDGCLELSGDLFFDVAEGEEKIALDIAPGIITEANNQVVLFNVGGVVTFGFDALTTTADDGLVYIVKATDYFTGNRVTESMKLVYDSSTGMVYLENAAGAVPEPTTTTLSLLALAALAARRRRK